MRALVKATLVGVSLLCAFPAFAAERGCVMYEPGTVSLKGKLTHGAIWLLELNKTICIEGRENDKSGMYPTKDAVKTVVLLTRKNDSMDNYGALVDKQVVIGGTLHHKLDNSADQASMMVGSIKAEAPAAPAEAK